MDPSHSGTSDSITVRRIFFRRISFLRVRALTNHRATLSDVYQPASKMRLYRGSSASRANLHNLVRLESLGLFSPFSLPFLCRHPPPSLSFSLCASLSLFLSPSSSCLLRRLRLARGRETRLLYTANEVKAPPLGPSYLLIPRDSRDSTPRALGLARREEKS